jgi:hypothetical protein
VDDFDARVTPAEQAILTHVLTCSVTGSAETVRRELEAFIARTAADELIISSAIFDHTARLRSYKMTAEARAALAHKP